MIKIKELREIAGLTQKELGLKLGLDGHNVGDWERQKCEPSSEMLSRIADVFDVSVDYLIGRTESDERQFDLYKNAFYTSSEEHEIIKAYRQLSFDQQQVVKVQLGALVEVNK